MDSFLRPTVHEFQHLGEEGFTWRNRNGDIVKSRAFLTSASCDAVALAHVRNTHQFNGEYGYPHCYHPRQVVERGNGVARVYPYNLPQPSLRSPESHLRDANEALEGNCVVRGVKGPSVIMLLPLFTMSFFCAEYMHGVLLGVTRQLFSLWFDSVNSGQRWYLGTRLAELDNLLEGIKPPNEISHTPTAIKARS